MVQGSVLGPTLFLCFINNLDMAVDMAMVAGREQKGTIIKWGAVLPS